MLPGCGAVRAALFDDPDGIDIGSAAELEEACEELETDGELVFEVVFEAATSGCDWGEGGNQDAEQGFLTARTEATQSLELDEGDIACDLDFEFTDISSDYDPVMYYDDNFVFAFNDVVLASSYAPWIDAFEQEGSLAFYSWEDIVGTEVQFSGVPSYCLGEEEGLADCRIPPPETQGVMALDFDDSLDSELAFRALEAEELRFMFAAMGDNDDSDCYHEAFAFEVRIPYVSTD
jgi:hypothetical protein